MDRLPPYFISAARSLPLAMADTTPPNRHFRS
jgi:hypothetical protein